MIFFISFAFFNYILGFFVENNLSIKKNHVIIYFLQTNKKITQKIYVI